MPARISNESEEALSATLVPGSNTLPNMRNSLGGREPRDDHLLCAGIASAVTALW